VKFGPITAQLWTQHGGIMGTFVWPGHIARMFEVRWGCANLIEKPLYVSHILAAQREEEAA
jgi:hypothetical protein